MHKIRSVIFLLMLAASHSALAQRDSAPSATDVAPKHLAVAEDFVQHLSLANTGYNHGDVEVKFETPYESHTDCSGFADALLEHCYGIDQDQMKKMFGSGRPTARRYHDAIAEQNGFKLIERVQDARPGDFLAIKYLARKDNTGHVMLVEDRPQRMRPKSPELPGTEQWAVTVIDSSKSGHGPTDTRHKKGANNKDHDGVGEGVFRIYTKADGQIAGFTWSTVANSEFQEPAEEHLVIGRLDLESLKHGE